MRTASTSARLLRRLIDVVVAPFGVLWFALTGRTPVSTYRVMRRVHTAAPGLVDPRRRHRTVDASPIPTGVLGQATVDDVVDVRRRLDEDGIAILDERLPIDIVEKLTTLARRASCRLVGPDQQPMDRRFDPDDPRATRYEIAEPRLLADPTVQRLLLDPLFRRMASAYLRHEVVNDLTSMWWTVAHDSPDRSAAAQMFHADRDRLSFVKVFAYLTDVGPGNGPHEYVRGSHRDRPVALRGDRRFTDDEVARHYSAADHLSIEAPAGTVFLADTLGLHRGLPPVEGHRLVFQLEYATGLLGAPYETFPACRLVPDVRRRAMAHPETYGRLLRH